MNKPYAFKINDGFAEMRQGIDELRDDRDYWARRAEKAEAKVQSYESAICFETTCTSCAKTLDSAAGETARADEAENRVRLAEMDAASWKRLAELSRLRADKAAAAVTRVRQVHSFRHDDGYEYVLTDELDAALDNGPKDE